MTAPDPQLTVVFDGYCGMCTRTRRYLEGWDAHNRIRWLPCQTLEEGGTGPVNTQACERVIWAYAGDDTPVAGSQAMMRIISTILGQQWPVTLGRLPVIKQALAVGYGLVARHRRYFPGDKPWCEQHPEQCHASS